MKKLSITLASFAILLSGCSSLDSLNEKGLQSVPMNEVTLEASFGDVPETKTVRKEDGFVYWKPMDEIKVFFGDASGRFVSTNEEDAFKTSFTGSMPSLVGMTEGVQGDGCIWGLYPYSEQSTFDGESLIVRTNTQIGVPGTFSDGSFIAVAKSSNFGLSFFNVLTGFKFSVNTPGITKASFYGNNHERINGGYIKISFGKDNRPVVDSVGYHRAINLVPQGGEFEVGKDYYFLFVPTEFEKGFKVSLRKGSETAFFEYNEPVTFARNVFKQKSGIDEGLTFESFPDIVDLGLPSGNLWSSKNLGASSHLKSGDYYSWGEIEPKTEYNWQNYKFFGGADSDTTVVKYCSYETEGTVDNLKVLLPEDDAATQVLGAKWCIPSRDDWRELWNNTTVTRTSIDGVMGTKLQSTVEGYTDKYIFLPAVGWWGPTGKDGRSAHAKYWTSDVHPTTNLKAAAACHTDAKPYYLISTARYAGLPIRPIVRLAGGEELPQEEDL